MQLINAPDDVTFPTIEAAIQPERIQRYLPAAGGDTKLAFQYYLWNCAICESFHVSLHFAEVVCRNALLKGLLQRCQGNWIGDPVFRGLLDPYFADELAAACRAERKQHGGAMTPHHVVSALTFGFWEHLATKRFDRFLWAKGVKNIFPCAPNEMTRANVHGLIESVRKWRNRIAHHRAIFDKGPMRKHQDALDLINIACADTGAWVAASSKVPVAISLRPKAK
jgi:hypothetical protein